MGSRNDRPDYDYSDGLTLQVHQLEDGKQAKVEIPTLKGKIETTFDIQRDGNSINVRRQGSSKPWKLFLVQIDSVENMENAEIINGSTLINVNHDTDKLNIRLR
jgi:alpha-D-xyloside xylohydrolase